MSLLPRRPIHRRRDGRFDIRLDAGEREALAHYLDELRDLLMGEDPVMRRLFPVTYVNDPEKEAGYQALMHGELLESRFAAIEAAQATLLESVVDEAQLTAWMQSINALRLVLGTRLDVSEDDDPPDPDDDDFELHVLYHQLGWLLSFIVDALTGALPPPTDVDPFDL